MDSHRNICNLLAYCTTGKRGALVSAGVPPPNKVVPHVDAKMTVGGPVCIIMEYAAHGNLKQYLEACQQVVRQSGEEPYIANTCKSQSLILCVSPQDIFILLCKDPLLHMKLIGFFFVVVVVFVDYNLTNNTENQDTYSDEIIPGLISESDIHNYAFQIACGLEHLEKMEVKS